MRTALACILTAGALFSQPAITGVRVYLNVADVPAQQKFWTSHFDAALITAEGGPAVDLHGLLLILRQKAPTAPSEGGVIDHFGLKVRNMAEMLQECRASGAPVLREFTGNEGFANAYVMAPGEVKVELQEDPSLSTKSVAHHIHYYVQNPGEIQNWYAATFGARPRKRGALETADLGGINLSFSQIKEGPARPGTQGRALDHIAFETKDLAALIRHLQSRGIALDAPHFDSQRKLGSTFLLDPVHATIELIEFK
jgi:catechol 2,3-dioxygenase-like lactoylglutathione lyase family enzyme